MIIVSRAELNKRYGFNKGTWDRNKVRLLDHLNDYMVIEEVKTEKGRYEYHISEDKLPEYIPPLPRKNNKEDKMQDYKDFTIASLGIDYQPNSQAKISRDAICMFGEDKYGHTNVRAVCNRYVGPTMKKYGEHTDTMVWVYYDTYEPIEGVALDRWFEILREEHISEKEMADAFVKEQQGEDITKERNYYKRALEKFKKEYYSIPIKVYHWRLKNND